MGEKPVLVDKKEHIGIITLNRPEHLNTFNIPLASGLNDAQLELEEDEDVRVIIIKGAGKGFCAGIDLNGLKDKTTLEYYKWVDLMEKMSVTIARMCKPVIASVHNVAVQTVSV